MDKNKCPFFHFGMENLFSKHQKSILDDNAVKNEHCMILMTALFFDHFQSHYLGGIFLFQYYSINETYLSQKIPKK
jgi:hypothetical protein